MPKRFRDTEIWQKPWFRKMTPALKVAWDYVLDHCDGVGVWVPDLEAAEFYIGDKVDWAGLREAVNGNIETLENGKWWVVDFCCFQHGDFLTGNSNAVKSYRKLAISHGLLERIEERFAVCGLSASEGQEEGKALTSPCPQGKGKGKGKGKGTGKGEGDILFDFDARAWSGVEQIDRDEWKKAFPACSIDRELAAAGAWLVANPEKRKSNYRRFLTNWLARSQERGGGMVSRKPDTSIKREAKPNPVCDVCGKLCERYFGHWKCADHGVREAVE
jgi:hypothetical protein